MIVVCGDIGAADRRLVCLGVPPLEVTVAPKDSVHSMNRQTSSFRSAGYRPFSAFPMCLLSLIVDDGDDQRYGAAFPFGAHTSPAPRAIPATGQGRRDAPRRMWGLSRGVAVLVEQPSRADLVDVEKVQCSGGLGRLGALQDTQQGAKLGVGDSCEASQLVTPAVSKFYCSKRFGCSPHRLGMPLPAVLPDGPGGGKRSLRLGVTDDDGNA